MAERRMFAKTIIDSDMFLDMPVTAQLLYFHLGMRADDDGFINNPKRIMRDVRSSDDDMKMLIAKNYIIPFESGVIVIKHWKMHNFIRSDRYKPSNCDEKGLVLLTDKKVYELAPEGGIPSDIPVGIPHGIPEAIPNSNQVVTERDTQDRLGKDRLGKDRLDIYSENSEGVSTHTPYQKIVALYHDKCPSLPKVQKITDSRKKAIKARWNEYGQSVDTFKECFERVEASDFLSGRSGKWSNCGFDWIMKESNFTKIMEGNYNNKEHKQSSPSQPSNGIVDTEIDWSKYDG
jgi:hypothetical protein